MTPVIISFFTPKNDDGYYERHAHRLRKECDGMGLRTHIVEVQFNGRPWEQVLKEKPRVILKAIKQLAKPVLWIDVDGSILHRPEWIEQLLERSPDVDFAAVPKLPDKGRPFYMGCSFWNHTEFAMAFLRRWSQEYAREDSEELSFGRAFDACKSVLKWEPLPKHYMEIDGRDPITSKSVVIHRLSKGKTKGEFYARMRRKK